METQTFFDKTPRSIFDQSWSNTEELTTLAERGAKAITILKRADEVYAFLRDFRNLLYFMQDALDIEVISSAKSHWVLGQEVSHIVEWDVEITEDIPGEFIAWQSLPGSEVEQVGRIWIAKALGSYGAEVRFFVDYNREKGKLREIFDKLFGDDAETLILKNLKRLKAYLETGEIPTIRGQPRGTEAGAHAVNTH